MSVYTMGNEWGGVRGDALLEQMLKGVLVVQAWQQSDFKEGTGSKERGKWIQVRGTER